MTTPVASSPTTLKPETVETLYPYHQISLNASPGQDMSTFSPGTFSGTPMPGFTPGEPSLFPLICHEKGPKVLTSCASDRPIGQGDYSGPPTMEAGVPWDEFTTISDPQMLATMNANKGQMMNLPSNVWNAGNVPSGLPASPMPAASPMAGHSQPINQAPPYTMQSDGTVWQVPPPGPSRTMSYPGQDVNSSYQNQYQQQMAPDLKRRMTTPAQSLSAGSQSSSAPNPGMQAPSGSAPYPGQPGMGYAQWPTLNAMPGMGVVPYPMYGEALQQHDFSGNTPPMGQPGGPLGRSGP